jgi:hypothetical protein
MTTITGTIQIGEAQATMPATGKRQRGSAIWYYVLGLCLMFGVGLVGIILSIPAKIDANTGLLIGMFGGLFIYVRWSKIFTVWRYRKTLMGQGVPLEVGVRWDLDGEGVRYQIGDITTEAPWRAVSEIFHERGWWIVMAQGTPMFAAERYFADTAAQRAFVGEVLSHLSDEARARSAPAVRFVEAP